MSSRRVLSVGQCGFDHGTISRVLRDTFAAEVVAADSSAQALTLLQQGAFDLVLVNRVFDRDGSPGLDLIRRIKADDKAGTVPVMLVSNFADAQDQAVSAGAVPGFGKGALQAPETVEKLKPYLAATD